MSEWKLVLYIVIGQRRGHKENKRDLQNHGWTEGVDFSEDSSAFPPTLTVLRNYPLPPRIPVEREFLRIPDLTPALRVTSVTFDMEKREVRVGSEMWGPSTP